MLAARLNLSDGIYELRVKDLGSEYWESEYWKNTTYPYMPNFKNNDWIQHFFKDFISLQSSTLLHEIIVMDCTNNFVLEKLPDLINVKHLQCFNNNLKNLPYMPNIVELNCAHNDLEILPAFPNLTGLDCSRNPRLKNIPVFPNLIYLQCTENINLESLPLLPNLKEFDCRYNDKLTHIPELPNVFYLICAHNQKLVTLSAMPSLRYMNCENNPQLIHFPVFPNLTHVECFDNINNIQQILHTDKIFCYESEFRHKYAKLDSPYTKNGIKKWQNLGLMPLEDDGIIVWKYVSPELKGNNGYPYEIGKSFTNNGMACAGPFGTVREYNLHPNDSRILAIKAKTIVAVDADKGIFYVYEGVPLACYSVSNITENSADFKLLDGCETAAIKSIFQ